jgi:polyisoprenoid-binding protein YceI
MPAAALTSLTALAKSSAASDGDPSVTSANAVLTTRQDAVRVMSGDVVTTNDPVYLLQVKGHFTAFNASVPSGAALPKGSYLSLVVNVSNGQVDDWGVGNQAADLSSLGPVITLHL